jgi:hypothetical protein
VYTLDEFRMQPADWLALAGMLSLAALGVWFGR